MPNCSALLKNCEQRQGNDSISQISRVVVVLESVTIWRIAEQLNTVQTASLAGLIVKCWCSKIIVVRNVFHNLSMKK